jgi:hypothetical protein
MTKLFGLFSFASEKELAATLAAHVEKNLPPKLMGDKRHILSANKIIRILEQSFEQAADLKSKAGLGFVRRAVLANNLKWELINRGFPDDFVAVVMEGLIVTLSKKPSAKQ